MSSPAESRDAVIAATRHWLTQAVIGLNLCPFAKAVHVKEQIRYAVSDAVDMEGVLADLETEIQALVAANPDEVDTTLLVIPGALGNFLDYNDCLFFAERMIKQLRLEGIIQIASFHPHYQFEDSQPDDIENYTNRAPYPILHLLREESIERAVQAFPDAEAIYERNQETLRRIGLKGWNELMKK
ncbi:DUF1415 domain-containing protein [Paraburkholderia aspalathi]|uniref:DUF1415 domain-containing protein n=1 Tax=Paraburkholderia aspalathi TaxID=1324617 RepID=A0A1I7EKR7_9BURK|nr:DUF1415 domain-containing protein [Paraburkholderia aspalathi]SFU24523.1 hypothetical protein SAMN05192563_1027116 [Paraburkholderia aspalathi]